MPTSALMGVLNPENPQMHSEDDDLPKIRHSLLHFGWAQYPTKQIDGDEVGYLLSGHGRVMSADFLSKQPQEWFDKEWEKWQKQGDRKGSAESNKIRFNPDYWKKCPVIPVDLDLESQKALMIRLNDTQSDGKADPAMVAKLLAAMKKPLQELSGWEPAVANNFAKAYLAKRELAEQQEDFASWDAPIPKTENDEDEDGSYNYDDGIDEDGEDYESKEVFERPDATDYSGKYSPLSQDEINIAQVDTSNINDEVLGVNSHTSYNPDVSEQTRFILHYSKLELPDVKKTIALAAEKAGFSMEGDLKEWRSQTVYKILKNYVGDFVSQIKPKNIEEAEENEED